MTKTRSMRILLAVAIAILSLALLSWAVTSVKAVPSDIDLVRISEETGDLATTSLMRQLNGDAGARTEALGLLTSDSGVLLTPDSTNKHIMTFDTVSEDLIDPDFLLLNDEATGLVIHGQSRSIERVRLSSLQLRKTVGLDTSVCAATDEISVAPGTAVTYCYVVTNSSPITLTVHDLVDSHLGILLDSFGFALSPGASVFLTQTALITQTMVNTATWTAFNPGPADVMVATDVATVTVVPPSISVRKTVGLDSSACAETDAITVPKDTAVTYCFLVTNTGLTTLGRHDLVDSHLGPILDDLPFTLIPGASAFITQTYVITRTTVNTATWTAYNLGPTDVVTATDVATVEVETFRIYLSLVLKN